MYHFGWYFNIKNQKTFDEIVTMLHNNEFNRVLAMLDGEKPNSKSPKDLAVLHYKNKERVVMVKLQVPSVEMSKNPYEMWLVCYEVKSLADCSCNEKNKIGTTYGEQHKAFTFNNTEQRMLEYARSFCE